MAQKSPKSKSQKTKAAAQSADGVLPRIIEAALAEAAAVGWAHLSFETLAERADLKLGDVLLHVPTKSHLLARFADHIDHAVFAGVDSVDHSQSAKDRLFELLMRRFDALQTHRAGVVALMAGIFREPCEAAMLMCRLSRSMSATLTAAGLPAHGLMGLAQMAGLKAVYGAALQTWRTDGSADLAKTMAALDKALGYAERAANFMKGRGRKNDQSPESATAES